MNEFVSKALAKDNLSELVTQIGDIAFKQFGESEIINEIPFISILKKVYDFSKEIKEVYFYQKLFEFLDQVKDIPIEERKLFLSKIERKGDKVGEKVLVLLNSLDDVGKAKICGLLLKNTILGNIQYDDFKRLTYIIDVLYYDDLKLFMDKSGVKSTNGISLRYVNLGLMDQKEVKVLSSIYEQKRANGIIDNSNATENYEKKIEYNITKIGGILIHSGREKTPN